MANSLQSAYRRLRYGEPIVVVSGLPRSGTSMAMKMLEAAGLSMVVDGLREADEDNPKGYFELERVKDLANETDWSWLDSARGKAIKIISYLLKELPDTHNYKVIFMRRDLNEVLASQAKMLDRRGESNETDNERMIDLYESDLQGRWLELALNLTEKQITLFLDEARGGFFNSSVQDLSLLMRMKELYDGVEPSPNAISVSNLLRLSLMSNNSKWKELAERTIRSFQDRFARSPHSMPQMKASAGYLLKKPAQIVIAGDADDLNARAILREVHRRFIPYRVVILADGGTAFQRLSNGSPVLRTMRPLGGKATAYICEDFACKYPTSDPAKVGELLDELRLIEKCSN